MVSHPFLRCRSTLCGTLLIVALAALPSYAQPVLVSGGTNFGGQNVGTPVVSTLIYTFPQAFSANGPSVVTQGVTDGDFQMTGGTCAPGNWLANQSCSVQVTFTPSVPGLRMGAVVFYGAQGSTTTYLQGVGSGPVPTPTSGVTPFTTLPVFPDSVAVDPDGNVYLGAVRQGSYGLYPMNFGLVGASIAGSFTGASAMAIDGAGNIYVSDPSSNCVWTTIRIGQSTTCWNPPAGVTVAGPLAVDGNGFLYIADRSSGSVLKFAMGGAQVTVAGCGQASCLPTQIHALALDAAGTLYVVKSGDAAVWKVSPGLAANPAGWTSIWQGPSFGPPTYEAATAQSLAVDGAGTVYVLDSAYNLWKVPQSPYPFATAQPQELVNTNGLGLASWAPSYITLDQNGNAWVVNQSMVTQLYELGNANAINTILITNGKCGLASGQTATTAPTQNLCTAGTAVNPAGSGPWTWVCQGTNGGLSDSCKAPIPAGGLQGVCGTPVMPPYPPASNLCQVGSPMAIPVAGYNPWTWTCSGIGGGSPSPTCSAKAAAGQGIDGQCGAATGYYILPDTAPTNGLCKVAGQPPGPSYNSATGVWNWLCTGINGGISVNCSSSPVSTAAAAATTVPKPASPLPGSSQTWSPAALHADSYGNVYVNYGTGIDRISSPAGLAVSCVNTSNGQCTGGLWTAYGDTQFCYINKYDYSTSPPTIGLSCGASSRTASPSLYFAVDSTGKHVYYTDSYRSGGNYVVYDVGSAVVGGGVGGVYLAAPTLTMDRDDNLYIGDENVIYKYDPNANITTTVAYLASGATATSVAADPHTGALFFVVSKPGYFGPGTYLYQGNLAIGQATGMYVTGLTDQNGQALAGHTPGAVALDSLDNLYILDASSPARVVMVTGAVQGGGSGGGGAGKAGSGVSAPVVNGYCGDAPWEFFNTKPTADLCDGGTASAVAGSGPWTWSCTGSAFGSSPSCSTYPVVLTVTANNASMVQGGPLPSLTASYTGLVNGDAAGDVLTGAPSLTTNATVNSPPGNYPITAAQGTLQSEVYNGRTFYNFAFVNGVLSVTKAPAAQLSVAAVFARVSNAYQATVTVTNSGTADAANVQLTTATLATANGSLLPQSQAKVTAGGGTATFVVTFPLTAGADGASVPAKFAGTYNGGSFSVSMRSVTLP